MDVLHIEAKYTKPVRLPASLLAKLPSSLTLFTTVQFLDSLPSIQKQLEQANITVHLLKARHTCYTGQMLGCSTNLTLPADVLYIGTGQFHPRALILRNENTVFTYNPLTGDEGSITPDDVKVLRKKVMGNYSAFLQARRIGVLITLKPGQQKAYLTKKLEETFPDKQFYYFVDNTFNLQNLQDFPFIDMFLNTMCERMAYEDMVVEGLSLLNIEDLWAFQSDNWLV